MNQYAHFEGKDALSHVKEARIKGKSAFSELHGKDIPSHLFYFALTSQETVMIFSLFAVLFHPLSNFWSYLFIFAIGWLLFRSISVAKIGWSRLERLHNLIEEERWEIEHHREQEKEELTELYQAKGFSGELLKQVIEILMSDDNRLLQIMLEEELGLTLEAFEHPLKQFLGAFLGIFISSLVVFMGYYWMSGIFVFSSLIILASSYFLAKKERRNITLSLFWNLGTYALLILTSYFLTQWIL